MKDAWKKVQTLLDELKPLLLRAGVPERQVTMPVTDPSDTPHVIALERYNEIFDWLHMLKMSDEWAEVQEAWKLVPPQIWAGYDMHEIRGLQEQVLLDKALLKLRKRWKLERPSFFGRTFRARGSKDEESESTETPQDTDRLREKPEDGTIQRRRRNRKRRLPADGQHPEAEG